MISQGPLEDRLAIRELIESYNDAVMRFDGDAWRSNWLEDAIWSLPGAGEIQGLDNFFPNMGADNGGFLLCRFLRICRAHNR